MAAGAVTIGRATRAAPAPPADPSAAADRDGDRATGRALPRHTGLGRDAWHLWSRWQRKLLSHTLAVYLCQQTGLGSLRFADLITN